MPKMMKRPLMLADGATELLLRRRCHGLDQAPAAKVLGVSVYRLCKFERGVLPVPEKVLRSAREKLPI